jgi:hypothetical protein
MRTTCDVCGQPATFYLTEIRNGVDTIKCVRCKAHMPDDAKASPINEESGDEDNLCVIMQCDCYVDFGTSKAGKKSRRPHKPLLCLPAAQSTCQLAGR